jgi:hypothetical protein
MMQMESTYNKQQQRQGATRFFLLLLIVSSARIGWLPQESGGQACQPSGDRCDRETSLVSASTSLQEILLPENEMKKVG